MQAKLVAIALEQAYKHKGKIIAIIATLFFLPVIIIQALNPFQSKEFNPYREAHTQIVDEYKIDDVSVSYNVIQTIDIVIHDGEYKTKTEEVKKEIKAHYIEHKEVEEKKCDENNKCTISKVSKWVFKSKESIIVELTNFYKLTENQVSDIDLMLDFQEEEVADSGFDESADVEITKGDIAIPFKHYTITAGTWAYPSDFGGGWHPGVDFGVPSGTKVHAPINVVRLMSTVDGNGYGVHGSFAGQKGADSYAFIFAHNTKMIDKKTFNQSEVLAISGNTGNSTGPHSHVEVFYFKNTSLAKVKKMYKSKGYWFGLGYSGTGNCNNVCRLRPEKVFGIKYGDIK